jgi:hypothetical protein
MHAIEPLRGLPLERLLSARLHDPSAEEALTDALDNSRIPWTSPYPLCPR